MKCCALLALVFAAGACGDDGVKQHDAAIDATPDVPIDAGRCAAGQTFFTGEFVDWDSNDGAGFCGIFGAHWTVHGDTTTDSTNPNGRFELCLNPGETQVDIVEPTDASQCTVDMGTYAIPGIAIANRAVIATNKLFSSRSMETSRETTFYASFSATFDQAMGQLFVHVEGTQSPISIDATSLAAQAFDGTTWAAGATGVDVFFPNITLPLGGTTNVTIGGAGGIGGGAVPLAAGTITYVTVVGN